MRDSIVDSSAQDRQSIRQAFRQRRQRLSAADQKQAAIELLENLIEQRLLTPKTHVALYKTHDAELSTEPTIHYCWQNNIEVYLPVLHPFSKGHLLFLHYTKQSHMQQNIYGIMEPRLDVSVVCPVQQLDVLFTPLVAFDENGNRLGMGGGFYDRTLSAFAVDNVIKQSKVKQQGKQRDHIPTVIGIAHDVQRTQSLPAETWDIPLPIIATPSRVYSFN
ncbi:MAG: 5-formyltetrahydrofolate cyclo-ligase [Pseudomonadota bacterium]